MKTTKQLVKFDFDVAVISALDAKYKDIQITDGKSYALVMAGLAEYRELRLAIDKKHKELKQDILEAGRGLDGDKSRLKALLEPGENHLKEIRQVEDDRKAAIKEEKDRIERERIEDIQEKINSIRTQGMIHSGTSSTIKESLIILRGMKISKEIYQEFTDQAIECQKVALGALEEFLSRSLQSEKENAERKAEAERLEAQKKEQEAAQAKIDKQNKSIQEEKDKMEAERKATADRLEREEFERQAKIKAEQEAKEKAEQAERDRIEKEEAEAEEKARQEALRPDKEKLIKFADELFDIGIPQVKSPKAQNILFKASEELDKLASNIKEQAKEL